MSIATSADGFIARRDGSFDWLERPRLKDNYGLGAFYKSIATSLWGGKTCDIALEFQKKGVSETAFDTRLKNYAFTRSLPQSAAPAGVEYENETSQSVRNTPAEEKGERHLDDGRRGVIPTLIGEGIPLIAPGRRTVPLRLIACKKFSK